MPTQMQAGVYSAVTHYLKAVDAVGVISTVLITGEKLSMADIVGFALIFAASASVLFARSTHAP
jgi:hypothetical protein